MNFRRIFLLSITFISFFTLNSCQKDDDLTPEDAQQKFVGAWNCEETSQVTGTTIFEVHIKVGNGVTQVLIENFSFLGFGSLTYANINGSVITIPHQVVSGHTVQGSGNLVGTKSIEMDYTVDDGSGPDQINAFFTKK